MVRHRAVNENISVPGQHRLLFDTLWYPQEGAALLTCKQQQ